MKKYDLEKLWKQHTKYEFETPDVEATLATMVEDAYVNHIPVMTGGKGKPALRLFYGKDFIPCIPPDFKMTDVSRTVGENRLVDEMFTTFTHTIEMPWMLPNIKPTGRYVEISIVAIVGFRDDKLAHENIYWDQASVLKQIGLLSGDNLPAYGAETARKVLDLQS
jgi:carboxymethylenebutenolidase